MLQIKKKIDHRISAKIHQISWKTYVTVVEICRIVVWVTLSNTTKINELHHGQLRFLGSVCGCGCHCLKKLEKKYQVTKAQKCNGNINVLYLVGLNI